MYTVDLAALVKNMDSALISMPTTSKYTVCFKNGHPFCFCCNSVSRDQVLVIFGNLIAKEICNRTLLTDLKEIAGTLRYVENQLRQCKIADDV